MTTLLVYIMSFRTIVRKPLQVVNTDRLPSVQLTIAKGSSYRRNDNFIILYYVISNDSEKLLQVVIPIG